MPAPPQGKINDALLVEQLAHITKFIENVTYREAVQVRSDGSDGATAYDRVYIFSLPGYPDFINDAYRINTPATEGPVTTIVEIRKHFLLDELDRGTLKFTPKTSNDSPLGAHWPEKGEITFHVGPGFTPQQYPMGAEWTGVNPRNGLTNKFFRTLVTTPDVGSPWLVGGRYEPAWQVSPNQ